MAGGILRLPSLRFLITLVVFLTIVHYSLSYSSPNYVDKTSLAGVYTDLAGRISIPKYAYREDQDDSVELPKGWVRGVAPGSVKQAVKAAGSEVVPGRRANAVFVILVRNQVRLLPPRTDSNQILRRELTI